MSNSGRAFFCACSRKRRLVPTALAASDLCAADLKKANVVLGQLLIGRTAEIAFENIYRQETCILLSKKIW